tara:strand:+ start:18860 stop:19000 length:141 start_codon:yes stop_codon:yes gene_type:complete
MFGLSAGFTREGLIEQPFLGLFNPSGFALARSSWIALQSIEPSFGF